MHKFHLKCSRGGTKSLRGGWQKQKKPVLYTQSTHLTFLRLGIQQQGNAQRSDQTERHHQSVPRCEEEGPPTKEHLHGRNSVSHLPDAGPYHLGHGDVEGLSGAPLYSSQARELIKDSRSIW